jgi:hypothetical protein
VQWRLVLFCPCVAIRDILFLCAMDLRPQIKDGLWIFSRGPHGICRTINGFILLRGGPVLIRVGVCS